MEATVVGPSYYVQDSRRSGSSLRKMIEISALFRFVTEYV
jgi:hypothetical protein